MNKENKAMKEIRETMVLVEYLIYHELDFDDIANFTAKTVKLALTWNEDRD